MPVCNSLKKSGSATLTIQSTKEIPFEFTLADGKGSGDGPLLVDCLVSVTNGVGTFVTGSYEHMNSYGYPATFLTQFPRNIVVEIVDRRGEIVKREFTDSRHTVFLGSTQDPKARYGKRFFVWSKQYP
jgi:hypothetical protein